MAKHISLNGRHAVVKTRWTESHMCSVHPEEPSGAYEVELTVHAHLIMPIMPHLSCGSIFHSILYCMSLCDLIKLVLAGCQ